jgi:hypothetical protein
MTELLMDVEIRILYPDDRLCEVILTRSGNEDLEGIRKARRVCGLAPWPSSSRIEARSG